MTVLYLDHHDSFSHIFCDYCRRLGVDIEIMTTDDEALSLLDLSQYSHLIIGAGYGHPLDDSLDLVRQLLLRWQAMSQPIPLLGVCLGHQLLAVFFGAAIETSCQIHHGKISTIECDSANPLFYQHPTQFKVCRYHSLQVKADSILEAFDVIARTTQGDIMALAHRHLPAWGLQYHPEAYLSEHGLDTLNNFFNKN